MSHVRRFSRPVGAVAMVAVLAGGAALVFRPGIAQEASNAQEPRAAASTEASVSHAKSLSQAFRQAAKDVIPSVVTIETHTVIDTSARGKARRGPEGTRVP